MKQIQVLPAAVFMMCEKQNKNINNTKNNTDKFPYKSPNITEATQKDWEDFFLVQEENIFDR